MTGDQPGLLAEGEQALSRDLVLRRYVQQDHVGKTRASGREEIGFGTGYQQPQPIVAAQCELDAGRVLRRLREVKDRGLERRGIAPALHERPER